MANFLNKVRPKNKAQLKSLIEYAFNHNIYDLNFIDTSKITNMSWLFEYISCNFDISNWDMSNVKNVDNMFYCCWNFNCDLSNWDVSNVINMYSVFYCCKKLNCDLSDWDVSFVSDFGWIFYRCDKMTIPNWYKLYHRK